MSPYEVLGVSPNASMEDIRAAYRTLVKKYHPDINPSPDAAQKTALINRAYDLLTVPASKPLYNGYPPAAASYEMEESPLEKYKREYKERKIHESRERTLARRKLEARIYQWARIVSVPLAAFSFLIILDFFLPVRTEFEVPLFGFQRVHHSRRWGTSISSFMKTPSYTIRVPNEVYVDFQYYHDRKKSVRLELTPIFKTMRSVDLTQDNNPLAFTPPFTLYSFLFFPLPYIVVALSLLFISRKEYNMERYTFCLMPFCLSLVLLFKLFSV